MSNSEKALISVNKDNLYKDKKKIEERGLILSLLYFIAVEIIISILIVAFYILGDNSIYVGNVDITSTIVLHFFAIIIFPIIAIIFAVVYLYLIYDVLLRKNVE